MQAPALPLSLASLTGAEREALLRGFAEVRPHVAAPFPTSARMTVHKACICIWFRVNLPQKNDLMK